MQKTVLFITREIVPFYYGGIGTQFKAMADLLVTSGFNVRFLTQQHAAFDEMLFKENYPGCDISFVKDPRSESIVDFSYSGGLVSHFNLDYALAVSDTFDALYNLHFPEFVVSADFGAEVCFCLLKKQAGVYRKSNFVLFIEGSTYDSLKTYESGLPDNVASELNDPQNRLTCSMENLCVRLADCIVSPTELTWQHTRKRLGVDSVSNIIPNLVGSDFIANRTISDKRQVSKILLFIGRLDHHKGADILLQAFLTKYGHSGDVEIPILRFVGRDTFCKKYGMTFFDYWEERIPSNLKRYIDFTGQVKPHTVKTLLEEATLCVFPSRWEVFGNVCLEAMSSGCPVVVSSNTGLSEVVGDSFQEFRLDFMHNSQGLFGILDRLFLMESKQYRSICNAFRQRSIDLIESGNKALLKLFDTGSISSSDESEYHSKDLYKEIVECLNSVNNISSVLAYDFNKIATFYGLNNDSLKGIILQDQLAGISDKERCISRTKRFLRFLIKQIEKLSN